MWIFSSQYLIKLQIFSNLQITLLVLSYLVLWVPGQLLDGHPVEGRLKRRGRRMSLASFTWNKNHHEFISILRYYWRGGVILNARENVQGQMKDDVIQQVCDSAGPTLSWAGMWGMWTPGENDNVEKILRHELFCGANHLSAMASGTRVRFSSLIYQNFNFWFYVNCILKLLSVDFVSFVVYIWLFFLS